MSKIYDYHFSPAKGWLNDPNGMIHFNGLYHCFFQHCRELPATHIKLWGHAVSKNLIDWEELDVAIDADTPADSQGIWSGGAIEKDGAMYLFYTGLRHKTDDTPIAFEPDIQFGQCLSISKDGLNFKKHPDNPLIPSYLPDGDPSFRDPSVFKYGDDYYMACASRNCLLYKSKDLIKWEYIGSIYDSSWIECPDAKPYGDKFLLIFSQGQLPGVDTTIKFSYGDFDGKKFVPAINGGPEKGPHFYAPQTMVDAKGRHILMGWMYCIRMNKDGQFESKGNGQHLDPNVDGALTIPRRITVENGKILSYPVEEFWHLLKDSDPDVIVTDRKVSLNVPWDEPLEYTADKIFEVKCLRDKNCLEVFINKGEAAFTYLY